MEKISIVMTTYNGEAFIKDQLDSIASQTLLPDEIIIFDDASVDGTVSIIEEFIAKNSSMSILFEKNGDNIGWKENFKHALSHATGSVVFLCDQDDIWKPSKIETMMRIMERDTYILLLASSYSFIYDGNSIKAQSDNSVLSDYKIKRVDYKDSFYIKRPGCTYCFRRNLIAYIRDYSFEEYPHDAFLWRTAAIMDGLYITDFSSIYYRRHRDSATSRTRRNTTDEKLETMKYYLKAISKAKSFIRSEDIKNAGDKWSYYDRFERWTVYRTKYLRNKGLFNLFHLMKYLKCYYSLYAFVGDIIRND